MSGNNGMHSQGGPAIPPWYRQFWPWFLISLPASVVVASIITINLAMQTDDGLVTEDYYKKGLAIHRNAEALQKARQLGIRAEIHMPPERDRLNLALTSDSNQAHGQLRIALRHPTRSDQDLGLALAPTGPNTYSVSLPPELAAANWIIELSAPESGWKVHGRMNLKKGRRAVLH